MSYTDIPQTAVGQLLNKQHPLAKSMKGFWIAGAGPRGLTWHDLTDSRNHALLIGAPQWSSQAPPGGFGSLDFSGGGGPYARISTAGLSVSNGAVQIEFKADSFVGNFDYIFIHYNSGNSIIIHATAGSNLVYRLGGFDQVGRRAIQTGRWYVATMTWNSDGDVWTYLDGSLVNQTTYSSLTTLASTAEIGSFNGSERLRGRVSSAFISDSAWSATEVRALYNESRQGYPDLLNRGRRSVYPAAVAPTGFVPYPYPTHNLTGGLAT